MRINGACRLAAGSTFAVMLAVAPALAQSTQSAGTTSGPRAGNTVQPSSANDKKSGAGPNGSAGAGAPGKAAEKGSESGPAPDQKPHP